MEIDSVLKRALKFFEISAICTSGEQQQQRTKKKEEASRQQSAASGGLLSALLSASFDWTEDPTELSDF